jgi:hypothetical protein
VSYPINFSSWRAFTSSLQRGASYLGQMVRRQEPLECPEPTQKDVEIEGPRGSCPSMGRKRVKWEKQLGEYCGYLKKLAREIEKGKNLSPNQEKIALAKLAKIRSHCLDRRQKDAIDAATRAIHEALLIPYFRSPISIWRKVCTALSSFSLPILYDAIKQPPPDQYESYMADTFGPGILELNQSDPRGKIVVLAPKNDWNRAMSPSRVFGSEFYSDLHRHFDVSYKRVTGGMKEVCERINRSAATHGPLRGVVLMGHGDGKGMEVGGEWLCRLSFPVAAFPSFAACFAGISKTNGVLALFSCSEGESRLAQHLRDQTNLTVFASNSLVSGAFVKSLDPFEVGFYGLSDLVSDIAWTAFQVSCVTFLCLRLVEVGEEILFNAYPNRHQARIPKKILRWIQDLPIDRLRLVHLGLIAFVVKRFS